VAPLGHSLLTFGLAVGYGPGGGPGGKLHARRFASYSDYFACACHFDVD